MPDSPPRTLKPVELLILTVLAVRDRHGYGIRQDILDQTQGRMAIEAGNLYRHLRILEDERLVEETRAPKSETDERRIYYRLTAAGRRLLGVEIRQLRDLVRLAEAHGI